MAGRLRKNREALERKLAGTQWRRWASPVLWAIESALRTRIPKHVRGRVLDAGSGYQPYRVLLEASADRYDSIDHRQWLEGQTYCADLQSMTSVPSNVYDAVLCSEVLEHVPEPTAAVGEIRRVLRPGGMLILTVPYLSRLHEEPHDFFRYTSHGLRHLLSTNGFSVHSIEPIGSVFSFAGHQFSTLLVGGTWHVPGLRWIALVLNGALITLPCRLLDRLLGSAKLPLGYVAVAVARNGWSAALRQATESDGRDEANPERHSSESGG